ncbi:putative ubiquitin conjugating enzyme [Delphinella strobiligena]|nr:putative ubiquitin conjugating enzyme [Delphinella strobiligena]
MAGKAHTSAKRILKELSNYERGPSEALVHLAPINDDDLMHWTGVMKGVQGTAYEGGLWQLDIQIPDAYPNSPPTIRFVTPICHPNVHFKTGEICLDLLKTAWSPAYTIASTLNSVQQLLTSAEPDSPLNIDIAQLFRQGDRVAAEALIRFYTETERWQPK